MDLMQLKIKRIRKLMIVERRTDTKIIFFLNRKRILEIQEISHRKNLTHLVIWGPEGEDRETRIKTIFKHVMLYCFPKLQNISN